MYIIKVFEKNKGIKKKIRGSKRHSAIWSQFFCESDEMRYFKLELLVLTNVKVKKNVVC